MTWHLPQDAMSRHGTPISSSFFSGMSFGHGIAWQRGKTPLVLWGSSFVWKSFKLTNKLPFQLVLLKESPAATSLDARGAGKSFPFPSILRCCPGHEGTGGPEVVQSHQVTFPTSRWRCKGCKAPTALIPPFQEPIPLHPLAFGRRFLGTESIPPGNVFGSSAELSLCTLGSPVAQLHLSPSSPYPSEGSGSIGKARTTLQSLGFFGTLQIQAGAE